MVVEGFVWLANWTSRPRRIASQSLLTSKCVEMQMWVGSTRGLPREAIEDSVANRGYGRVHVGPTFLQDYIKCLVDRHGPVQPRVLDVEGSLDITGWVPKSNTEIARKLGSEHIRGRMAGELVEEEGWTPTNPWGRAALNSGERWRQKPSGGDRLVLVRKRVYIERLCGQK